MAHAIAKPSTLQERLAAQLITERAQERANGSGFFTLEASGEGSEGGFRGQRRRTFQRRLLVGPQPSGKRGGQRLLLDEGNSTMRPAASPRLRRWFLGGTSRGRWHLSNGALLRGRDEDGKASSPRLIPLQRADPDDFSSSTTRTAPLPRLLRDGTSPDVSSSTARLPAPPRR